MAVLTPATLAQELSDGRWQLPPHLALLNRKLMRVAAGKLKRLMIFMPPRHGKALEVSTPIPTPAGWVAIGDLQVGDFVFDEQGQPTQVVNVSPVWKDRPVYRVTSDSGQSLVADAAHEWPVRLCRKRPDAIRKWETQALAMRQCDRKPQLRKAEALVLPDADLPVDPYTLGVWLGDGSKSSAVISARDDDAVHTRERIGRTYRTTEQATRMTFGVLGLQVQLKALGVYRNKHVPAAYLRASREQRLALLQGLIDTDGYVAPRGQIEFCSTTPELASGVRELVVSLGYKASLCIGRSTINGKDCGEKYRVMFYMPDAAHLPRKKALCIEPTKQPHHYLSFEEAGRADTVCIEVASPSHLFLAGEGMWPTCNSEFASHYFPAWYLGVFPHSRVMLASYEATFAATWGRKVREAIAEATQRNLFNVRLAQGNAAVAGWGLEQYDRGRWRATTGGMYTAGAGGALTGRGFNLGIIDDPVKNAEEAMSATYRDKLWDWYNSTFATRAEPDAAQLVILTRWHEDDLAGRIIANADPDNPWEVLSLPALAEEDDPLGREPGQALWPQRYDEQALAIKRRENGEHWFAAMYQQRPTVREGGFFKRAWFKTTPAAPVDVKKRVRFWDKAATEGGGDWTVGCLMSVTAEGIFTIEHVVRVQASSGGVKKIVCDTAVADGAGVEVCMEQEPGSAGKDVIADYAKALVGYRFRGVPATGSKQVRADPLASQAEAGNLRLVEAGWNTAFIDELCAFDRAEHDDQVDAASGAFGQLAQQETKVYLRA